MRVVRVCLVTASASCHEIGALVPSEWKASKRSRSGRADKALRCGIFGGRFGENLWFTFKRPNLEETLPA